MLHWRVESANHLILHLFIFGFDQSLSRDAMMIQVPLNTTFSYVDIIPCQWKCINPIQTDLV